MIALGAVQNQHRMWDDFSSRPPASGAIRPAEFILHGSSICRAISPVASPFFQDAIAGVPFGSVAGSIATPFALRRGLLAAGLVSTTMRQMSIMLVLKQ